MFSEESILCFQAAYVRAAAQHRTPLIVSGFKSTGSVLVFVAGGRRESVFLGPWLSACRSAGRGRERGGWPELVNSRLFFFFLFLTSGGWGKIKLAHQTSTYFHTRRVSRLMSRGKLWFGADRPAFGVCFKFFVVEGCSGASPKFWHRDTAVLSSALNSSPFSLQALVVLFRLHNMSILVVCHATKTHVPTKNTVTSGCRFLGTDHHISRS